MKVKLRENFAAKALAFAVAVAAFAAAATMAWYQLIDATALWGKDRGPADSFLVRQQLYVDEPDVELLLILRGMVKAGETLSDYDTQEKTALEERLDAANTNLRWQLLDLNDNVLAGNTNDNVWAQSGRVRFNFFSGYWNDDHYFPLYLWVDGALPVADDYVEPVLTAQSMRANRGLFLGSTIFLAALSLALAVYLCAGAGHKQGVAGIHLNGFHRLPGDVVFFMAFLGVGTILGGLSGWISYRYYFSGWPVGPQLALVSGLAAVAAALVLMVLVTFAARLKAHTVLRSTLIWRGCSWCWRVIRYLVGMWAMVLSGALSAIPLIWKAVLGFGLYGFYTLLTMTRTGWYYLDGAFLLWAVISIALFLYLLLWAYQWKRIRQGTREIIGRNPYYHIASSRMLPDLRAHADELNNLGQAITAAAEARVNSERFKAELITNVSHDLKTPLTSIINYVDLLKKEQIDNPRALEYIEVLDRKSQRLKKLTEDLVEASKASTGTLTVSLELLDFRQLTDQALAECGERLAASGLNVVRSLPEEPVWVEADGRHLWRVLDNMLTNCAKYALPNTRVYVDLRSGNDWAELCVKNISRDPLDIAPERLMERFVRGDESRTAQGSGLGLSIAQSLAELQHGHFAIDIDGDLFKATVTLPLAPV